MEAKMTCPHCGGRIAFAAEDASVTAPCPHCGANTLLIVPPRFHQSTPTPDLPKISAPDAQLTAPEKTNPAKKIRDHAETVGGIGIFSAILGCVATGFTIISLIGITSKSSYYISEVNKTLFIGGGIAGGLFWIAVVLIIISQLLHLRANTHRDL